MKKNYGVGLGILALGLAALGAPAGRAQSRAEANGVGGASVASATTTASASASSPAADLDRRIEALEEELVSLRTEMAARKEAEEAAALRPAPIAQDKPADKISIASLLGPTSVSGFIDTYYMWTDHPSSHVAGACAFNCRDHSISLNMIELILDKAPDPMGGLAGRTGYHFSVGYGDTQVAINNAQFASSGTVNTSSPGGPGSLAGFDQYIKEAYFSYLAPMGSGLQIDVGKFVTPMGAEVIEAKDNWNYSRGLLFNYAIPINHFGVRAKYVFNSKLNATGYLVNGFNNVVDNNSGKTYGVNVTLTPTKKATFAVNYFAGPENPTGAFGFTNNTQTKLVNVNDRWRQTWDVIFTYNLTPKLTFMANYDYVHGERNFVSCNGFSVCTFTNPVYIMGEAGYLKYAFDDKNTIAARYEYFYDRDGAIFGPLHGHIQEFTATYQRTLATHLMTRLEYRRDMTSIPNFFQLSNFGPGVKQQSTITLGMIFLFDSRDAK